MVVCCLWSSGVCGHLSSVVVYGQPLTVDCGHPIGVHRLWSSVDRRPLESVIRCPWSTIDHRLWSPCQSPSSIICDRPLSVIVTSSSRQSVVSSSVIITRQSLLSCHWLVGQLSVVVGGHWLSTVIASCRPHRRLVAIPRERVSVVRTGLCT